MYGGGGADIHGDGSGLMFGLVVIMGVATLVDMPCGLIDKLSALREGLDTWSLAPCMQLAFFA